MKSQKERRDGVVFFLQARKVRQQSTAFYYLCVLLQHVEITRLTVLDLRRAANAVASSALVRQVHARHLRLGDAVQLIGRSRVTRISANHRLRWYVIERATEAAESQKICPLVPQLAAVYVRLK